MVLAGLLQVGAALALDAGFAWLTGSLFACLWLQRTHPQLLLLCERRLRHGELAAGLACVGGSFAALWMATAQMADVGLGEAVELLPMVMLQTAYGQAGLAALLAAVLVLAVLLAPRWRRERAALAALLLAFALARAAASHAGEHGVFSVAVAIEWLHLALIGVWLGGVGLAGWLVLPKAREHGAPIARYLAWLSKAATLALAGIVASGAFNAWQRLGGLDDLYGNPYGLALTVKLALFALAVLLGAYNKFAGFPDAARGQSDAALMVLRLESLVLTGALAAAAILASLPPPG